MKKEWAKYLKSIGMQEVFCRRVADVYGFYQNIYPDQIKDIFVTEYVDKDNPVRFDDAFVESLNIEKLGFKHSIPCDLGKGKVKFA